MKSTRNELILIYLLILSYLNEILLGICIYSYIYTCIYWVFIEINLFVIDYQ